MGKPLNESDFMFKRFGTKIVIEHMGIKNNERFVKAVCDCGNIKICRLQNIKKNKASKICTCIHGSYNISHNLSKTKLYRACALAINRCHNSKSNDYVHYSSRGITVYEPWRNNISLMVQDLFNEIGDKPDNTYSLDRIDNNKGYVPSNIKWSTRFQQSNNRSNNIGIKRFTDTRPDGKGTHDYYRLIYRNTQKTYSVKKWGEFEAIELLESWKTLLDVLDRQ